MKVMLRVDKIKYAKRGNAILKDLQENPEKMKKLEDILRENGFGDIADLAIELKNKYL